MERLAGGPDDIGDHFAFNGREFYHRFDARLNLCVIGLRRPTPMAFREMIKVGGSCWRLNSLAGDSTRLRISRTKPGSKPVATISLGVAFCSKYNRNTRSS